MFPAAAFFFFHLLVSFWRIRRGDWPKIGYFGSALIRLGHSGNPRQLAAHTHSVFKNGLWVKNAIVLLLNRLCWVSSRMQAKRSMGSPPG